MVRKFFLHVSKKEQKRRFLERIENPEKNWKFSSSDAEEREHWDEYMEAYEEMIRHTATKEAPWYVVPADNKWFTRVVVAAAVIEALASLELEYPEVGEDEAEGTGCGQGCAREEIVPTRPHELHDQTPSRLRLRCGAREERAIQHDGIPGRYYHEHPRSST